MKAFKYNREDDFYLGNDKYGIISLKSKLDELLNKSGSDYKRELLAKEMSIYDLTRPALMVNHLPVIQKIITQVNKVFDKEEVLDIKIYINRKETPEAKATVNHSLTGRKRDFIIILTQHFMNELNYNEKLSVIITGGASGIGEAIARIVINNGGNVGIIDLNSEKADLLSSELGERCSFRQANVTDEPEFSKAYLSIKDMMPPVTGCVTCAGVLPVRDPISKHTLEDFRRVLDNHISGTFLTCKIIGTDMAGDQPLTAHPLSSFTFTLN